MVGRLRHSQPKGRATDEPGLTASPPPSTPTLFRGRLSSIDPRRDNSGSDRVGYRRHRSKQTNAPQK